MMKTIIITNDAAIASDAEAAGVSRIMVDLESIGKKERQASRNTFISTHKPEDIALIRKALKRAELIVRINPWHEKSKEEIDGAIKSGAEIIMLPMITDMTQFNQCAEYIGKRARLLPLVETAYSMEKIAAIAAHPSVPEVYIGLNDLHLSLKMDFLFEPLAKGLLDSMAEKIHAAHKPFGFGGIAVMGSGELPAEYILAEHVRLGSCCVILSSRFCKDVNITDKAGRVERIRAALASMQQEYKRLEKRSSQEADADYKRTSAIIQKLADTVRSKRA